MEKIYKRLGDREIWIGRRSENNVRQVVFDVSGLLERYGTDGMFTVICRRPGDHELYPCVAELDGSSVLWTITSAETAFPGFGKMSLAYRNGNYSFNSHAIDIIVSEWLGYIPPAPKKRGIEVYIPGIKIKAPPFR
jgi:hypothetical protein